MSSLSDLFDSVDGLTDDLTELAVISGTAVGTGLGAHYALDMLASKVPSLPPAVLKYGAPVALVAASLGTKMYAPRGGVVGNVGTGVSVGLFMAGLQRAFVAGMELLGKDPVAAAAAVNGLGAQEVLLGNTDMFQRYLGNGVGSAPVTVEAMNGLSAAPVQVEELNGTAMAPTTVEVLSGGSFARGGVGVASSFQ